MLKKYIDDLNNMISILEKNHLDIYFNISKDELNDYIEYIKLNYQVENDYQFMYIVRMILKKLNGIYDSHTRAIFSYNNILPLKLKIIDNKLYIIDTIDDYKNICFNEIVKINDIDIKTLIEEMEKTISYSTKEWLYKNIEDDLVKVNYIKSLPSIGECDNLKFTLRKENNFNDISFDCSKKYTRLEIENKNYTFQIYDGVLKINYTFCVEPENGYMLKFIKDIHDNIVDKNITKVIIDIRGNLGGNDLIIKNLINYINSNFENIIVLQDGAIFSGGRFALNDLKQLSKTTCIGTNIGTQINCFGNLKKFGDKNYFELPNSKFKITCSTRFYYYENNKIEFVDNKKQLEDLKENKNYLLEPIYFEPDIFVENDIEDYIDNKDLMLEESLKILEQKLNKK